MRVLIVESGFARGALAACRALARAGWTVGIGSPDKQSPAASSRYADRWHEVPPVVEDLDAFLEATQKAVIEGRYEAVFCSDDAQALGLSFGRNRLSAKVPYPPHDVVVRAFDKLELYRAALQVGMATPETAVADERAIDQVALPVVVKSRLHWTLGAQRAPARLEATICSDRDGVRRRVSEIRAHGGDAILQEFIRGRLVNYAVIVDAAGEIVARAQSLAEPLLYSGPDVGTPTRSESVPIDEALHENITALMKELEWMGMTSLQLLLSGDREPAVIDFNGRFTNRLAQYVAAGPNFPHILACLVTGRPLPPDTSVKAGVRFQLLEYDLRRALKERRGGLLHDVVDCLSYARRAVHTSWHKDDPAPAVFLGMRLARQALFKLRTTLSRVARRRRI